MRIDKITVASLVLALGIVIASTYIIYRIEFTLVTGTKETLGQQVTLFLSTFRVLDLITISLLVFAAIACCIAMLRE
ncbi:MAG: hypothetical protein ACE5OY_01730 [Candidatus Bathyarchaeia archaeon]